MNILPLANQKEGGSDTAENSPTNNARSKSDETGKRKRIRVPTSCSICRKRKIKCDKSKPVCSGCSKSNVGHLCRYEEPAWVNPDDSVKENKPTETVAPLHVVSKAPVANLLAKPILSAATPSVSSFGGLNFNSLPPQFRKTFEELTARVKHLEASIAVHDLSSSIANGNSTNNLTNASPSPSPFPMNQSSTNGFNFLPPPSTFNLNTGSRRITGQEFINGAPSQLDFSKEEISYDFDPNLRVQIYENLPFFIKKTRLEAQGPFSVLSLMRQDAYLKVLWIYIWKSMEQSGRVVDPSKEEHNPACINSVIAQEAMTRSSGRATSRGIANFLQARKEKVSNKAIAKEMIEAHPILEDLIVKILPRPRLLITLCVRFFRHVYPFLPFIDENSFFGELNALTQSAKYNSEKVDKLLLRSKYDYATLGLLMMVLRFAYISISEEELQTNKEFAELKENPISVTFVAVALKCFEKYKFLRKSYGLKVMQLGLYIKLYYRYCPEDDDISDCSNGSILLGTLFAMAHSIGLNRDPSLLAELSTSADSKPQAQIWKRIWHTLLDLDSSQAMTFGLPLHCSDDSSYTTPLPTINSDDDAYDSFVNNDYRFLKEKIELYRKIANTTHNMRNPPSILQVTRLLKSLETFASTKLGSFKEILNNTKLTKFEMVKKICYLLEIRTIVLHMTTMLQKTFEEAGDFKNSFIYLADALKQTTKISNSLMNLVYNESLYFGHGFFYYLKPTANFAITRCVLVWAASNIRLVHSHKRLASSIALSGSASSAEISRLKLLKDFLNLTFSKYETYLQLFNKISSHSYNFSKIYMAMRLYHLQLGNPLFDFKEVADQILDDVKNNRLSKLVIHDLKPEDIPESNQVDTLLDGEIQHLIEIIKSDIFTILQPAVSTNLSKVANANKLPISTHLKKTDSSSNISNDPFNSYNPPLSTSSETKSDSNTPNSSLNEEFPTNRINLENIFGLDKDYRSCGNIANRGPDDGNTIVTPVASDPAIAQFGQSSASLLTSEEYASLFGIFDEYTSLDNDINL